MEVKAWFWDPEKVFLSLNRDVPSIEVTNRQVMYGNILLNGGVPKETEGLTLIKAIIIINYNLLIITLT